MRASSAPTQLPVSYRLPIAADEKRFVTVLTLAIACWAALACISFLQLPSASHSPSVASSYTSWVIYQGTGFACCLLIAGLVHLLRASGNQPLAQSLPAYWRAHRGEALGRLVMLAAAMITFGVLMTAYTTLKVRITVIVPFMWDEAFADLDRRLFLGADPWTLFRGLYDHPFFVRSMDFIYDFWTTLLIASWALCFAYKGIPLPRRLQYCLALILTWFLGGNILATALSSAGPCYYDHIVLQDADRYAEQMALLAKHTPLRTLFAQDMLWAGYAQDGLGLGAISAMPSMHCATAFLFFLMFGRAPLSRAFWLTYYFVILFGSFFLAWHYLVDGLLGAAIAAACWWVCGKASRKLLPAENPLQ